jgi:HSP20 family protein
MTLVRWNPTLPFIRTRDEFEKQFDNMVRNFFDEELPVKWYPPVDVEESEKSLIVRAEIPGMDKKDIHISLKDNVLTIRGEKKYEKSEDDSQHHYKELRYGSFCRYFALPVEVDDKKVKAEYKKGVLTITLPKTEKSVAKEIPISLN